MRHRLEHAIVRTLLALVRMVPGPLLRASGTVLGLTFYTVDRAHRRIAQRNLATAFPSRSASERRAIARAAFAHFGRLLLELLRFATLSPAEMLARAEFDGEERARLAYAQGKGVLFITGHFGFWELHAMVHAVKIRPIGVLARALDNPHLDRLLEHIGAPLRELPDGIGRISAWRLDRMFVNHTIASAAEREREHRHDGGARTQCQRRDD